MFTVGGFRILNQYLHAVIPARFDVLHRQFSSGAADSYGNPSASWSVGVAKKFVTFAAPRTSEPKLAGHDRDVVELELIVLPGFGAVSHRDRMVIDGATFEVVGGIEDYSKNPWRNDFGCYTINLKAVHG